ncbi:hypothetical protein KFK09_011588 [Dendrobium nobile]|uniref:Uncharacterized protein n=1 Tax=Dendrobium nobile TaxID=94219 RepID=A0A8T3BD30_DENNO|nr:hypothetical protein KFK09_011588 [Dendrobium nobile]
MSDDDPTTWWKMDLMIRHSTLKWRGEASSSPFLGFSIRGRSKMGRRELEEEGRPAGARRKARVEKRCLWNYGMD